MPSTHTHTHDAVCGSLWATSRSARDILQYIINYETVGNFCDKHNEYGGKFFSPKLDSMPCEPLKLSTQLQPVSCTFQHPWTQRCSAFKRALSLSSSSTRNACEQPVQLHLGPHQNDRLSRCCEPWKRDRSSSTQLPRAALAHIVHSFHVPPWLTLCRELTVVTATQKFGVESSMKRAVPASFLEEVVQGQRGMKRGAAEKMRGPAALGLKNFARADHHDLLENIVVICACKFF